MWVYAPVALTVTVPLDAGVASVQTLPPSPDGVSLPLKLPLIGVSSVAAMVSATATGTSFTAATLMVTVAVEVLPSISVMV